MLIYIATNKINGKQYVGQTTLTLKRRKEKHIWNSLAGARNGYFNNAIRKYCPENFDWKILHDDITNIDDLNKLEIFYIGYYNTFENGYNLTKGGRGPSRKARENMSRAQTGRKHSEKTKRKISDALTGKKNPNYGKKASDKTRQRLSKAQKGRKVSEETKRKQSVARKGQHTGKDNPAAVAVVINNKCFDTITDAAKFFNTRSKTVSRRLKRQVPGYRYANK